MRAVQLGNNVHSGTGGSGGPRRHPERRTTRLMMMWMGAKRAVKGFPSLSLIIYNHPGWTKSASKRRYQERVCQDTHIHYLYSDGWRMYWRPLDDILLRAWRCNFPLLGCLGQCYPVCHLFNDSGFVERRPLSLPAPTLIQTTGWIAVRFEWPLTSTRSAVPRRTRIMDGMRCVANEAGWQSSCWFFEWDVAPSRLRPFAGVEIRGGRQAGICCAVEIFFILDRILLVMVAFLLSSFFLKFDFGAKGVDPPCLSC